MRDGHWSTDSWDSNASRQLAANLARSYLELKGEQLLPEQDRETARRLYEADFALLCHDGADDPLFNYANLTAQRLWSIDWKAFIGLPSRLSAQATALAERAVALDEAAQTGLVTGYQGVRIAATGSRFRISDATIWNVTDGHGNRIGQAARIPHWHMLES